MNCIDITKISNFNWGISIANKKKLYIIIKREYADGFLCDNVFTFSRFVYPRIRFHGTEPTTI